jgi:hypothetical protein
MSRIAFMARLLGASTLPPEVVKLRQREALGLSQSMRKTFAFTAARHAPGQHALRRRETQTRPCPKKTESAKRK